MPSLHELQREFTASVFDDDTAINRLIRGHGLAVARRFAIYRNNTFSGLTAALREEYPVTERLVGKDFFSAMARDFIAAHPPEAGCLLSYGAQFSVFTASYRPASSLPYLPDVVRLEWAWHEAFHAKDALRWGLGELAGITAESFADLHLYVHPSVRVITSTWPVLRIFEVNQPDYLDEPILDLRRESAGSVLIVRNEFEVELHRITEGSAVLLEALSQVSHLETAYGLTQAQLPNLDLTTELLTLLSLGAFAHPPVFASE